ncbi:MAG: RHS repeat-associated core domain-containing protein, partial [Acidobacteriota bacterium]
MTENSAQPGGPFQNIVVASQWTIQREGETKLSGSRAEILGPFGHFQRVQRYDYVPPGLDDELSLELVPRTTTVNTFDELTADPNSDRWKMWFIHKLDSQVTEDGQGTALRRKSWTYTTDGRPLQVRAFLDPAASTGGPEDILTEFVYDPVSSNLERSYRHKAGETLGYGLRREYDADNIFVVRSWHLDPAQPAASASQAFSWPQKSVVRESGTGTVVRIYDAAADPAAGTGPFTDLSYDTLGRTTTIAPSQGEEATHVCYPTLLETDVTRGYDPCQAGATPPPDFTRTRFLYDALGRLVEQRRRTESGCEAVQKTIYDILGQVTFVTQWGFDATCPAEQMVGQQLFDETRGTATQYDALGRVVAVTTADGKRTTMSYTAGARTVTLHDVDGQEATTYIEQDAFGKTVLVEPPAGARARYRYDPLGRLLKAETLTAAVPGPGFVVQPRVFSYDGLGRLTADSEPESGTMRVTGYDAAGRSIEQIDSAGTRFSSTYDAAGRLLSIQAEEDITPPSAQPPDPRVYAPARTLVVNRYDEAGVANGAGRLTSVDSYDETGALIARREMVYGGLNARLSEDSSTFAGWDGREGIDTARDPRLTSCYSYDAFGRLAQMRYPAAEACVAGSAPAGVALLTYGYSNSALVTLRDDGRQRGLIDGVVYSAAGGVRRLDHGNGLVTEVPPDVMSRPGSFTVSDPSDPNAPALWATGDYTYDGAGNVVRIGQDVYHYDLLSRLTGAQVQHADAGGLAHTYDIAYQYDDFGNMLSRQEAVDGGAASTATLVPDPLTNRLQAVNGTAVSYDQRGNQLADPDRRYLFDRSNRLLAVAEASHTYPDGRYRYDAAGQRIAKISPATGTRTFYVRDTSGNVLSQYTLAPSKYDTSYQQDYFYALGHAIGMAREQTPAPVEGLTSTASWFQEEFFSGGTVSLSWTGSQDPAIGYRVYRKQGTAGTWAQVGANLPPGTSSYSQSVSGPATLFYRVAAYDTGTGLESMPSRTLRFAVGSTLAPAAPAGLTLQEHERAITLRWQRSVDDSGFIGTESDPPRPFQGYQIYRRAAGTATWVKVNLLPLTDPVFEDLDVTPQVAYDYQVRALDTAGAESAGTLSATATAGDETAPAPPVGLRALSGPDAGAITLVWASSPEPDVVGYRLYQKQAGGYVPLDANPAGGVDVAAGAPAQFLVTGLVEGQASTFAVAAKDAASYSALSADATATARSSVPAVPANQTAIRVLTWTDARGAVILKWDYVPAASSYRIYRRDDEQGWADYHLVGSTDAANLTFTDTSLDHCRAYAYMVRAVDAGGVESPDPQDELFVQPILRPNTPVATGDGSGTITLTWGGMVGCAPAGNGYGVDKWIIKRSTLPTDPNTAVDLTGTGSCAVGPGNDDVIVDAGVSSCTITGVTQTGQPGLPLAMQAKVRNIYHETIDPADALALFDSFISDDICTTITGGTVGNTCADLAGNDAGTGGGGSGADPDDQIEPGILLRRVAVPPLVLPAPAGSAGLRLASAEAMIQDDHMQAGTMRGKGSPPGSMMQDSASTAAPMPWEDPPGGEGFTRQAVAEGLPAGRARPEARGKAPPRAGVEATREGSPTRVAMLKQPLATAAPIDDPTGATGINRRSAGRLAATRRRTRPMPPARSGWVHEAATTMPGFTAPLVHDPPGGGMIALQEMADMQDMVLQGDARRVATAAVRRHPGPADSLTGSPRRVVGAVAGKPFALRYFHWDHLGNTRLVTDEAGQILDESKFLPFGTRLSSRQASSNTHQFTGHERDTESGLDYMLARYYAGAQARFLTPDPVRGKAASPQSWNRYAYVRNSPMRFADPQGLEPAPEPKLMGCLACGGSFKKGSDKAAGTAATKGGFSEMQGAREGDGGSHPLGGECLNGACELAGPASASDSDAKQGISPAPGPVKLLEVTSGIIVAIDSKEQIVEFSGLLTGK